MESAACADVGVWFEPPLCSPFRPSVLAFFADRDVPSSSCEAPGGVAKRPDELAGESFTPVAEGAGRSLRWGGGCLWRSARGPLGAPGAPDDAGAPVGRGGRDAGRRFLGPRGLGGMVALELLGLEGEPATGPSESPSLRLLMFIIRRPSPLLAPVPAGPLRRAPLTDLSTCRWRTLPFCPSDCPTGAGALAWGAGAAEDLIGSSSNCSEQRRGGFVGHMRRELEAAYCEP